VRGLADERALPRASRKDGRVAVLTSEDAESVRCWLESNQFRHVSMLGGLDASFGNVQDVWEREGTLVRLTRDRGQWWYDLSRNGSAVWLDVDLVSGAMGYKQTDPAERVAVVASTIDDRVFGALGDAAHHSP
jgi:hypothetical protein